MNQERFDIEYEGNRILENTRIDGNLKTDKSVYLDGMIQGNVHAGKLVIINKGGKVDGDVDCDELYINGTITGNVCVACKTVMEGDAVIEGGLITDTLEITLGATIRKGLKLKKRRNKLR